MGLFELKLQCLVMAQHRRRQRTPFMIPMEIGNWELPGVWSMGLCFSACYLSRQGQDMSIT